MQRAAFCLLIAFSLAASLPISPSRANPLGTSLRAGISVEPDVFTAGFAFELPGVAPQFVTRPLLEGGLAGFDGWAGSVGSSVAELCRVPSTVSHFELYFGGDVRLGYEYVHRESNIAWEPQRTHALLPPHSENGAAFGFGFGGVFGFTREVDSRRAVEFEFRAGTGAGPRFALVVGIVSTRRHVGRASSGAQRGEEPR